MRLRSETEKGGDRVVSLAPGDWHSRLDHEVRMHEGQTARGEPQIYVTYGRPGKPKVSRGYDVDAYGRAGAAEEFQQMVEAFILPLVVERLTSHGPVMDAVRRLAYEQGGTYRRTHDDE